MNLQLATRTSRFYGTAVHVGLNLLHPLIIPGLGFSNLHSKVDCSVHFARAEKSPIMYKLRPDLLQTACSYQIEMWLM